MSLQQCLAYVRSDKTGSASNQDRTHIKKEAINAFKTNISYKSMEIRIKKSVFYSAIAILVLFAVGGFWVLSNQQEQHIEENLEEGFAYLSNANTNACRGPDFIDDMDEGARLQGSCCSPMDLHRYREQIEGLEEYAYIQEIPKDPYDIPVSQARELLEYGQSIRLNPEQQATYEE